MENTNIEQLLQQRKDLIIEMINSEVTQIEETKIGELGNLVQKIGRYYSEQASKIRKYIDANKNSIENIEELEEKKANYQSKYDFENNLLYDHNIRAYYQLFNGKKEIEFKPEKYKNDLRKYLNALGYNESLVTQLEQTNSIPEQTQTITNQTESDKKEEKSYENMSLEELEEEQANVVQEMIDSNRNFTDKMVEKLTKIVDALATKYKEEMESYVTKAIDEICAKNPELLKRKDYDNNQNYYIANRWLPGKNANDYSPSSYIQPPRYLGNESVQEASGRFIKVEDLDKYNELVKKYDSVFKFRRDKLSPYIRDNKNTNKVTLNSALKEMQKTLKNRGFSAISVEPIQKDETDEITNDEGLVMPEPVPTHGLENIEKQMASSMSDLKEYIRQMGRENMGKYMTFTNYQKSASKNNNLAPERKLDLDNIVTILNKFNHIISETNRQINKKESIINIFKNIKELHSGIEEAENIVKDPKILDYLKKWNACLKRFADLSKEYIAQEEQEKGRTGLPSRVQTEPIVENDKNKQEPIALPAAKTEKSYKNMILEELEELLGDKKTEKRRLENAIGISGEEPNEEEKIALTQLDAEIKKIEEEIAKRREQERTIPMPTKTPTPTEPTQEWRVEKRSAWQWVKDHKKQILIAAGLAAVAIATVVALQGLIPAITASMQANSVSATCQVMLTNAANWHTAIASEQATLHGANTALGSIVEAMTGNKAIFDTATGIWKFGQSGMELGAFAKEAALTATKAAAKVTSLSRTAGLLGLGGLGSMGTGILLQNRSAAYKVYNETIKEYKEGAKIGGLSGKHLDDLAKKIMNEDKLSNEEMQKLLRKLTKLSNKVEKHRNESRKQLEEVETQRRRRS